jgi:uncharacterized membrane protein YphA (DoxX/SURF4 family)
MTQTQCCKSGIAGCYDWAASKLDYLQPVFLLLLRVYVGYQAGVAGWAHLHNVDKTAEFFQSLSIPHPRLNVYIAGTTELVCGGLLLAGLAARLAAIPFSFNFVIAILAVDHADPKYWALLKNIWNSQDIVLKDDAFPFLFVGVMVLIFGPGKLSLDELVIKPLVRGKRQEQPQVT